MTKRNIELKQNEEKEVKLVAMEMLGKLKGQQLVLDRRIRQQKRASVRTTIEEILDGLPPIILQSYTRANAMSCISMCMTPTEDIPGV